MVLDVFLLTPLREGRRGKGALIASFSQFLLTPLREGRRNQRRTSEQRHSISTHAPAGGATLFPGRFFKALRISTHAPAGGATLTVGQPCVGHMNISTHAPAGGATVADAEMVDNMPVISTHAPAGGATYASSTWRTAGANFYSRPCGRGDRGKPYPFPTCKISTHAPAGGAT